MVSALLVAHAIILKMSKAAFLINEIFCIQIRGMRFMFEMSRCSVSKCTSNYATRKGAPDKNMKFEFVVQ